MTTTVKQTICPLLMMCLVFGIGIYFQEKVYLSVFYSVTIWICYSCLFYYTVIAFEIEYVFLNPFFSSNLGCSVLTLVASVVLGIVYDKRFRIFLKRLETIDYTLSKLDTSQTYKRLHRYVKGMITAWCIGYIVSITSNIGWWRYVMKTRWCILIPFVTTHVFHANHLVNVLFLTLLWYIGTRFDKISEHLECLLIREEHELRCTLRRPIMCRNVQNANNYKHIFWTSMHLHLELCQIARELNTLFETQMTLEIISSFIFVSRTLVYHITYIIQIITNDYTPLTRPTITWINFQFLSLLHVIKMFYINFVCETVSAKAKKIEKIIHRMTYFFRYADIYNEIHQFTLQIIHNPLKFSGLGLFDFGYNFLQRVITSTVTLVIFGMQNLSREDRMK